MTRDSGTWIVTTLLATAIVGCGQAPPPPPKPVAAITEAAPSPSIDAPGNADAALDELRAALAAAQDEDARVLAVDALASLGQKARGAYDDLVKATADGSARVRWHAARALGLIGEDAVAAVPLLVRLLDDGDPIVATQAAAAIGLIRADDEVAADMPPADKTAYEAATVALVGKITHPDGRVRRAVLRSLATFKPQPGQFLPLVSERLADADPSVVLPALHSLADMGADAVPFLVGALRNPKSRYWASVALAELGNAAAPAVPELAKGITSGETEERMQSIMALAAIGEPALAAADEIAQALAAPEGSLRFAAAFALGRLRATTADQSLARAAGDADPFLAAIASWARARIHPEDAALVAEAVEKLSGGLASPKPSVQSAAVSALSDLGGSIDDTTEKRLVADFVRLLSSPEAGVRQSAAAALVREGPLAVEALENALADPEIRGVAMEILTAIGPVSKDALDSFIVALADPDPALRGDAAVAIAAVGPQAAEAVPQLEKILTDSGSPAGLRYAAAYALGRIGPSAAAAADTLKGLAESDDELLATVAVWAALKIQPDNSSLFRQAVPMLRRALRDSGDLARLEAAVALGDIGPAAAEAVPILELVSEEDPLPAVRSAAKQALGQIRPTAAPSQN